MKNVLFILALLYTLPFFGQEVIIVDGATVKTCGGILTDSGGSTGAYQNSENIRFTICPENDDDLVQLNFTEFQLENGNDVLSIFNGANENDGDIVGAFTGTQNPGLIVATDATPTGCLTIIFQTDATVVDRGFTADISCIEPCQTITSQIDSATPSPDSQGFIKVCPGDEITLTGSGNFEDDGSGATYQFDLGDGRTIDGQTATFSYNNPGVYLVNLNIRDTNTSQNPDGCKNTNIINQVVQVGTEPDLSGSFAENEAICLGNETTIRGIYNPTPFEAECTPPVSGTTFLPDGTGVEYSTCITVDCFDNNQTLQNGDQLLNICINMEHSWAADLDISIVSPDGREIDLFSQKGENIYFGSPIDDEISETDPGTGRTYCFSMSASDLLEDAPLVRDGNPEGNSYQPGTYLPIESFNGLAGSVLNGEWCLKIRDNISRDNGFIFEWNMEFDPSLVPAELSFSPDSVSETWDSSPSITETNGSDITVRPTTIGQHCYTFRTLDEFGCEYTEQVCVEVFDAVEATQPETYKICDNLEDIDGFGQFNLSSRDDEILNGQNPNDFNVTYFETLSDADQNLNALPNSYNNVSNPQTVFARVDNTSAPDAICYEITELVLEVDLIPDLSLPENVRVCTDSNGSEEVNDPILETGLSEIDYTFEWFLDGAIISSENGASIVATEDGLYTVEVTDINTGCTNSRSTDVVASSPPDLSARVTSQAFARNNTIEATAGGLGEYEFSLNGGDFQSDGRFSNVPSGTNTVTARDLNGCGMASVSLTVLNFPKFFTPNGDGRNDTWNIKGISGLPNTVVYIYDRYGKLLKQFNANGGGWNGRFKGISLPSSDYWFTVEFNDPSSGNRTSYSSHFSLRR